VLVNVFGMYDILANCFGIGAGTMVNFLINSRITWVARKKDGSFSIDRQSIR
jgi:putative flippase GtrA